ncbi:hypothetical protein GCM10027299_58150 [Larkinella ripae]
METNKGVDVFYAQNRTEWRQWLAENGQSKKQICLIIYHQKSRTPGVSYHEAVEEALYFG